MEREREKKEKRETKAASRGRGPVARSFSLERKNGGHGRVGVPYNTVASPNTYPTSKIGLGIEITARRLLSSQWYRFNSITCFLFMRRFSALSKKSSNGNRTNQRASPCCFVFCSRVLVSYILVHICNRYVRSPGYIPGRRRYQ